MCGNLLLAAEIPDWSNRGNREETQQCFPQTAGLTPKTKPREAGTSRGLIINLENKQMKDNNKEYISIISRVVEKMSNLPNARFWAIWFLCALIAAGYLLGKLAEFMK